MYQLVSGSSSNEPMSLLFLHFSRSFYLLYKKKKKKKTGMANIN